MAQVAVGCYQSCKDKNFKAIHNQISIYEWTVLVVINLAKIKILKQFTTSSFSNVTSIGCYQSCKDKNFKAIHNCICVKYIINKLLSILQR